MFSGLEQLKFDDEGTDRENLSVEGLKATKVHNPCDADSLQKLPPPADEPHL